MSKVTKPNIRYWLYKKNWSATRLAKESGLSIDTVVDAKNGKRMPFKSSLKKMAKALGIKYDDLFIDV